MWEKSGPNATFNLFFPWVGGFVGFIIIFTCFPTQQNFGKSQSTLNKQKTGAAQTSTNYDINCPGNVRSYLYRQQIRPVVERRSIAWVFFAYGCANNFQDPNVEKVCLFVATLKREEQMR